MITVDSDDMEKVKNRRRGTNVLESRIKYQKHRLKKFESFDENKTEWDIMLDEGYDRVWDCGNAVYVLE